MPIVVIAIALVINSSNPPQNTGKFHMAIPIPETQIGGRSDVAIATPAILFETRLFVRDSIATAPEARATIKSKRVGVVLPIISAFIIFMGEKKVNNADVRRVNTTDKPSKRILFHRKCDFDCQRPYEIPTMGHMSGEIIIPPTITGVEFIRRPRVLTIQAAVINSR